MKTHTNKTGSLDVDVALEGFTTFMVRPWRIVQLATNGKVNIPLTVLVLRCKIFIERSQDVVDILSQPRTQSIWKNETLLWARPAELLNVIEAFVWWKGFW